MISLSSTTRPFVRSAPTAISPRQHPPSGRARSGPFARPVIWPTAGVRVARDGVEGRVARRSRWSPTPFRDRQEAPTRQDVSAHHVNLPTNASLDTYTHDNDDDNNVINIRSPKIRFGFLQLFFIRPPYTEYYLLYNATTTTNYLILLPAYYLILLPAYYCRH